MDLVSFAILILVLSLALAGIALKTTRHQLEISQKQLRACEKQFQQATERFELAASAVRGLVYEWDAQQNHLERTHGLLGLLGFSPEEAEPTIEWWNQRVHPDDLLHLHQTAQQAIQSGDDSVTVEYRVRHRNGDYRYVWDRIRIERDANGQLIRTIGFNLDITDRKQAEEALRESEERFRTMADTAPVLIWMSGIDQGYNYFNQSWLTFTGRSLAQEIGNGWTAGVHPDDLQRYVTTYGQACDARRSFTLEYRLRRSDGEYRWILDTGIPRFTPDGSFVGYIGSCVDISDRKYSEEVQLYLAEASKVLSSSLDYQTTLGSLASLAVPRLADWCIIHVREDDGSVHPLVITHSDPDKITWATQLVEQYPYVPDEPYGVAPVLRTGQSEIYPYIPEALLLRSARDEAHLDILRTVGFSSAMVVPLSRGDRILGAISFVAAESGRHYGQSDLVLAEELAHRAALAVDNARLYQIAQRDRLIAEAANCSKDEFLRTLSHELRTPLNAILGWMQILNTRQIDGSTIDKALETVYRNSRALKTIIEDLLDISRITSGKLHLKVRPVDLMLVVKAAIETVQPAATARSIDIQLIGVPASTDDSAFWIMGDSDRLQQVVWNLLSNAVKFTSHGGQVTVQLVINGDEVVLSVVDTGVGISADFLPYVFDRFRQADMSTTKFHGGLGLGLAIVRHLVEMQGGTVQVESPGLGEGATFIVKLPRLHSDPHP